MTSKVTGSVAAIESSRYEVGDDVFLVCRVEATSVTENASGRSVTFSVDEENAVTLAAEVGLEFFRAHRAARESQARAAEGVLPIAGLEPDPAPDGPPVTVDGAGVAMTAGEVAEVRGDDKTLSIDGLEEDERSVCVRLFDGAHPKDVTLPALRLAIEPVTVLERDDMDAVSFVMLADIRVVAHLLEPNMRTAGEMEGLWSEARAVRIETEPWDGIKGLGVGDLVSRVAETLPTLDRLEALWWLEWLDVWETAHKGRKGVLEVLEAHRDALVAPAPSGGSPLPEIDPLEDVDPADEDPGMFDEDGVVPEGDGESSPAPRPEPEW